MEKQKRNYRVKKSYSFISRVWEEGLFWENWNSLMKRNKKGEFILDIKINGIRFFRTYKRECDAKKDMESYIEGLRVNTRNSFKFEECKLTFGYILTKVLSDMEKDSPYNTFKSYETNALKHLKHLKGKLISKMEENDFLTILRPGSLTYEKTIWIYPSTCQTRDQKRRFRKKCIKKGEVPPAETIACKGPTYGIIIGILKRMSNQIHKEGSEWLLSDARVANEIYSRFEQGYETKEKCAYLEEADYLRLINSTDNQKWKLFWLFAGEAGMRKSEVMALQWSDLIFLKEKGYISISKKVAKRGIIENFLKKKKVGEGKRVPMSERLMNELLNYKDSVESLRGYIFHGKKSEFEPVNVRTPSEIFDNALLKADIDKLNYPTGVITYHSLRDTFAVRFLRVNNSNQMALVTLKDILGHRNIETTLKYARVSRQDQENMMSNL